MPERKSIAQTCWSLKLQLFHSKINRSMAALVLPASSFKGINTRCVDTIWVPGRRGNCSDFKTMCVTKCKVVRCQCLTCFWPRPFVSDSSGVGPSDLLLSVQRKLANRAASMSAIWLSRSKYILFVRMLAFLLKVARSGAEKQSTCVIKSISETSNCSGTAASITSTPRTRSAASVPWSAGVRSSARVSWMLPWHSGPNLRPEAPCRSHWPSPGTMASSHACGTQRLTLLLAGTHIYHTADTHPRPHRCSWIWRRVTMGPSCITCSHCTQKPDCDQGSRYIYIYIKRCFFFFKSVYIYIYMCVWSKEV